MPAYNAQAVTTEDQIMVPAPRSPPKGGEFEELDPMISAAERELEAAGVAEPPGSYRPTGYWQNDHIGCGPKGR